VRTFLIILLALAAASLHGQKWERLNEDFAAHAEAEAWVKAGEVAARQVNYCVDHLDSTDLRFMLSYYNLGQAYYGMDNLQYAKGYLAMAYKLMVPFYTLHGKELADVCTLLGKVETRLGYHESAASFLTYARDMHLALFGKASRQYIGSLYNLAELEMARSDWESMTETLAEALELHDRYFPKDSEFARYANYLGLIYMNNGGNSEAVATFTWALESYDGQDTPVDYTYAHISNNIGLGYYYLSQYAPAARYFEQADSAYQLLLGEYSENYMMLLNNLASLYFSWDKPERAGLAYRKMEQYLEDHPRAADLNYIQALENAASYHAETGEPGAAEKFYKQAIRLRKENAPGDPRQLAGAMLLLARLYAESGRSDLAHPLSEEAYGILARNCPDGDPDLVTGAFSAGYHCQMTGRLNEALRYYNTALRQAGAGLKQDPAQLAMVHNNMGAILMDQGRLLPAIPHLEKAHELEPGDPAILYNMGHAFQGMGDVDAALGYFNQARDTYRNIYGEDHPEYAQALIQGVITRFERGDFSPDILETVREAESIYLESGEDTLSKRFMDCVDCYRAYYHAQKEYRKALSCGRRNLVLSRKKYGRWSAYYGSELLGQAGMYTMLGETAELGEIYRQVERITERMEGEDKRDLLYSLEQSRASNYYYLGEYMKSRESMEYVVMRDKEKYRENQAFMTPEERGQFVRYLTSLVDYNDFLFHFPDDPEVLSNALNNRLFIKSILMEAELQQRRILEETSDSLLIAMNAEHAGLKIRLSNARSQFGVGQDLLDSLAGQIRILERDMSRRMAGDDAWQQQSATWKGVRDALGPGEAAVEVVFFYHTTAPPEVTYHPWYYAFVITGEMEESPLCIRLFDAVEAIPRYESYRRAVENDPPEPLEQGIYDLLWSSIDQAVEDRDLVYFSGDNLFHELNIEALKDGEGQYIMDKYRVRNVHTLADLLKEPGDPVGNHTAFLAGDPVFKMAANDPLPEPEPGNDVTGEVQSRMFPGTRLSPLPGTRTEVDSITSLLMRRGWEVTSLTGQLATEDAVVSVSGPRVLHLATHGFFAGREQEGNPEAGSTGNRSFRYTNVENMSKSCLFFSGAQNTLYFAYDYAPGHADGILTAYEISDMDLKGTELVVLSACETGLGDVLKTEGVTGLRRAFRLAGARRIMLSLWDVDDQATQLIMREFYANWLSGMDMDQSLTEAKRTLRDQTPYSHPRYWAAFILTGI